MIQSTSMVIALAVRLGATNSKNIQRLRALAAGTYFLSFVVFGVAAVIAFICRGFRIGLITTEPQVVEICTEIWLSACLYFFFI
jgi:Na+-driven multidrug efflux pump